MSPELVTVLLAVQRRAKPGDAQVPGVPTPILGVAGAECQRLGSTCSKNGRSELKVGWSWENSRAVTHLASLTSPGWVTSRLLRVRQSTSEG